MEYVFNVPDTRPVRGAREPQLWELTEEKSGAVAEVLAKQHGLIGEGDIGDRIMELAVQAADEAYQDYLGPAS